MLQLWRISEFANLSGEGTERYEARWHSLGHRVVYLAASPAAALLEILVHLELDRKDLPERYPLLEIHAPGDLLPEELHFPEESAEWKQHLLQSRGIGNEWLRSGRSVLAKVPSAILPGTWNFLLNPDHPDAARIQIGSTVKTEYDARLFRTMR